MPTGCGKPARSARERLAGHTFFGNRLGGNEGEKGVKRCPTCQEDKPETEFHRCRQALDGRSWVCAACHSKVQKESRGRPAVREHIRRYRLLRRYGITVEQFETLLAFQNGRCIACSVVLVIDGKPGCRGNSANVDHDHKTNLVRGILCWNCNRRLGVLESQPDLNARLLAYAAGGRLIAKAMSDSSGRREPDGQEAASHRSRG